MKKIFLLAATLLAATSLYGLTARADTLVFNSGGTLEGRLLGHSDGRIVFQAGSGTVYPDPSQVARIERGMTLLDPFYDQLALTPDTAEGHANLGIWARDRGFREQAREQFSIALGLDPNNAAARWALGFEMIGGQWQPRSQLTDRGVARPGSEQQRQASWAAALMRLNNAAFGDWFLGDQAQTARAAVLAIRDPAAVVPLVAVFGRAPDMQRRIMLAEALGNISDDQAAMQLLYLLTRDPDPAVGQAARLALRRSGNPVALQQMRGLMQSSPLLVRSRLAPLLADLGDRRSIPYLINSLALVRRDLPVLHRPTRMIDQTAILDQPPDTEAILEALLCLTGRNFGTDVVAWGNWYAANRDNPALETPPEGCRALAYTTADGGLGIVASTGIIQTAGTPRNLNQQAVFAPGAAAEQFVETTPDTINQLLASGRLGLERPSSQVRRYSTPNPDQMIQIGTMAKNGSSGIQYIRSGQTYGPHSYPQPGYRAPLYRTPGVGAP